MLKKFSYLLSLLFLLEGSILKRFKIIKEINEAIKQRTNEGNTLNEAIDSVGHVQEIVREYNSIHVLNNNNLKFYFVLYIMTSLIISILIICDFIRINTGTSVIHLMTSSNSSIFITSKVNITLTLIKICIEFLLLLYVFKKIIKDYIYYRTR